MTSLFNLLGQQAPDNLSPVDTWQNHALCGDEAYDPELWFPVGEGTTAQQQADDAKAICYQCPVIDTCLRWAIEQRQDTGIWGGLTEQERRRLHRRKSRTPSAPKAPRTPAAVLARYSQEVEGGHLVWTGKRVVGVGGVEYTPTRLAWLVADKGPAEGQLVADCGHRGCINPDHLLDAAGRLARHGTPASYKAHERRGEEPCEECKAGRRAQDQARRSKAPAKCGTRSGYQGHRRRGEEACAPCRQANADADRRLRNTGTTKPLADNTRPPAGGARCGTAEGYTAHRRWAEKACPACLEAHQAAARAAADAPSLPTCGTRSGYDTHTARGEAPCRPCTDARARTDWLLRQTGTPLGRTA